VEQLRAAIMSAANGAQFTERRFKQLLELNVRPLYNEIGHLDAKFSSVTIAPAQGAGTVTTKVDEGPTYSLGTVKIAGDSLDIDQLMKQAAFQSGKLANWRLIEESIERIRIAFKTDGFLFPSIKQNRVLLTDNTANLTLSIAN
jgi:outer membrane protein assembly factor BamA